MSSAKIKFYAHSKNRNTAHLRIGNRGETTVLIWSIFEILLAVSVGLVFLQMEKRVSDSNAPDELVASLDLSLLAGSMIGFSHSIFVSYANVPDSQSLSGEFLSSPDSSPGSSSGSSSDSSAISPAVAYNIYTSDVGSYSVRGKPFMDISKMVFNIRLSDSIVAFESASARFFGSDHLKSSFENSFSDVPSNVPFVFLSKTPVSFSSNIPLVLKEQTVSRVNIPRDVLKSDCSLISGSVPSSSFVVSFIPDDANMGKNVAIGIISSLSGLGLVKNALETVDISRISQFFVSNSNSNSDKNVVLVVVRVKSSEKNSGVRALFSRGNIPASLTACFGVNSLVDILPSIDFALSAPAVYSDSSAVDVREQFSKFSSVVFFDISLKTFSDSNFQSANQLDVSRELAIALKGVAHNVK